VSALCARSGCDEVGTHRPSFWLDGRELAELSIAVCGPHQEGMAAADFILDERPFEAIAHLHGLEWRKAGVALVWKPVALSMFERLPRRGAD